MRGLRICDPFRAAGFFFLVAERHFEMTCPCGVTQRGDVLIKRADGNVMLYDCPKCGATLIGVARDDRAPDGDNADGHRMCGFVFGSTVDMGLWPPAAVEPYMEIPARPGFFKVRGCATAAKS